MHTLKQRRGVHRRCTPTNSVGGGCVECGGKLIVLVVPLAFAAAQVGGGGGRDALPSPWDAVSVGYELRKKVKRLQSYAGMGEREQVEVFGAMERLLMEERDLKELQVSAHRHVIVSQSEASTHEPADSNQTLLQLRATPHVRDSPGLRWQND